MAEVGLGRAFEQDKDFGLYFKQNRKQLNHLEMKINMILTSLLFLKNHYCILLEKGSQASGGKGEK